MPGLYFKRRNTHLKEGDMVVISQVVEGMAVSYYRGELGIFIQQAGKEHMLEPCQFIPAPYSPGSAEGIAKIIATSAGNMEINPIPEKYEGAGQFPLARRIFQLAKPH